MLLTTGVEIQGYFITDYIDVVFDEMLVGLGLGKSIMSAVDNWFSSLTGSEATEMLEKLTRVKMELRERIIRRAQSKGANALIGIDFESSRLGDLLMVSMTATAVKVEKIIEPLPVLSSLSTANSVNSTTEEDSLLLSKFPVSKTNYMDRFVPINICLVPLSSGYDISVEIRSADKNDVCDMLCDIEFISRFGDQFKAENICCLCFKAVSRGIFRSKPYRASIPEHIALAMDSCIITVKKCIRNGVLSSIEDKELSQVEKIIEEKEEELEMNRMDVAVLIKMLEEYRTAKEMLDYIISQEESIAPEDYSKLVQILKEHYMIERAYGANKKSTLRDLQNAFKEELIQ